MKGSRTLLLYKKKKNSFSDFLSYVYFLPVLFNISFPSPFQIYIFRFSLCYKSTFIPYIYINNIHRTSCIFLIDLYTIEFRGPNTLNHRREVMYIYVCIDMNILSFLCVGFLYLYFEQHRLPNLYIFLLSLFF